MTTAMLTHDRLREALTYSPATGIFRWKVMASNRPAGAVAGSIGGRYRQIRVDGRLYQANRLAWLYMIGKWPKFEIGFINCNRFDTRWPNLREMTPAQRSAKGRHSKLGVTGVYTTKSGKYVARITLTGNKNHLGIFDSLKKASAAYAKAAFGQFARAR